VLVTLGLCVYNLALPYRLPALLGRIAQRKVIERYCFILLGSSRSRALGVVSFPVAPGLVCAMIGTCVLLISPNGLRSLWPSF